MAKGKPRKRDDARQPKQNHLISRRKFREFVASHPGTEGKLPIFQRWCKTVEQANWSKFADVKAIFGDADRVGQFVVFNVGGNKYRVVAFIKFKQDKPAWIYIKHVLTHKEYDEGDWKGPS